MAGSGELGEQVLLVLDCSEASWAQGNATVAPSKRCSFQLALESTLVLQNAIELFHADNETQIVAACHPNPLLVAQSSSAKKQGGDRGKQELLRLCEETGTQPVSVAKALLVALCVANKQQQRHALLDANLQQQQQQQRRIVLIVASPVPTADFVTCMNCAFAAQKLGICVDVFDFSGTGGGAALPPQSPTLQQLVHHTNGWYVNAREASQGVLAHMLLAYFAASQLERTIAPVQLATDMRSVCFCHQRLIDVGFVCSVCLAVFCEKPGFFCKACKSKVHVNRGGGGGGGGGGIKRERVTTGI